MDRISGSHPLIDPATPHADVEVEEACEWSTAIVEKPGSTTRLLFSVVTCVTALIYNVFAIFIGHVALRNIPIYPFTPPAFVDADLTPTLFLAILGSSVLAIPILLATFLTVQSTIAPAAGACEARQTAAAPVPRGLARSVPPPVHAFLWEAWMISAAPMGSLLCNSVSLEGGPGSCLDAWHAALAGLVGRVTLLAVRRVGRSQTQPDIELRADIGRFSPEKPSIAGLKTSISICSNSIAS